MTPIVSDGSSGGGGDATLLGPFHITKDTANLVNPADNGVNVGTIPAKSLILAIWVDTTTPWVAATSFDEADFYLDGPATGMGVFTTPTAQFNGNGYALQSNVNPYPHVYTAVSSGIFVAFYTTGAMTAGVGDVYALYSKVP